MQVRIMKPEDYPAVYGLWRNTPGMGLNTKDDSREGIEKYLRRNPTTCFVAEDASEAIIGAILSGHDGRRGYISHTAVSFAHRGKGIGKALVQSAMEALDQEGIAKVALVVFKRNAVGNAFWEGQGFTEREDLVYRNKEIRSLDRIDT